MTYPLICHATRGTGCTGEHNKITSQNKQIFFSGPGIGILVDGMLRLAGHTPETFLVVFRQTITFGGEWWMVPYGFGIQYLALKTGLKNAFFADQILVMGPQPIPVCCCVIA